MFNILKNTNKFKIFFISLASIVALFMFVYLWCLPKLFSNVNIINFIQKTVKNNFDADIVVKNPSLMTEFSPWISLNLDELKITKGNDELLYLEKLKSKFSIKDVIFKRIIIKRISLEAFHIDVNKLLSLLPQQAQASDSQKFDWDIDVFDALMYARDVKVFYEFDKDTKFKIFSKGFGTNNAKKSNRRVYFNFIFDLERNGEHFNIALKDQEKVIIDNKTLYINDLPIRVNNSNIFIKGKANRKVKYDITAYSKKFDIKNVISLINSNLLLADGKELLAYAATNIDGTADFDFNFSKKGLEGNIDLNTATFDFVALNNLPVKLHKGHVDVDNYTITLKDFEGKYCNNDKNKIVFNGTIKDYMKTMQMDIKGDTFLTNDLMKEYLSKIVGFNISLIGDAGTKVFIKSKNNKYDILAYSRLLPEEDILIENMSLSPKKFERILKADMHFEDMNLKINSIDYYIGFMKEGMKDFKRKSIMALSGNVDCSTYKVLDMGINVADPLPSEFFNVFFGPKFFRKGYVSGKIHVDNYGKYPILDADMVAKDIRIPSQRLKVTEAKIKTDSNHIHIDAIGKFKRSDYSFKGNIENNLTLPVIINDVDLSIDYVDIDRILQSFNQQNTQAVVQQKTVINPDIEDESADDAFVFDTGLIVVKDCNFYLKKANYNDINMGNLHAKLTLDENGLLQIASNRFDFAEGISSLKVNCDLLNHNYYVRLGIKDVNSDIIASSLLGLKKEISGKAKGLIELNADNTLKMNGRIKFAIEDGTIEKVGFLEYVLKFASLFRNPMAMLSPSTFVDLVNIPEGNFDTINGELNIKDNNIELLKIKSRAPQLSSYIVGCFNLETRDAILRVYTKMSNKKKGFYGVLRNFSLNSLANRLPLGNANETNYYSNEIKQLPEIDAEEKDCQIFLTKIDGDVERNNFISSLKRIK